MCARATQISSFSVVVVVVLYSASIYIYIYMPASMKAHFVLPAFCDCSLHAMHMCSWLRMTLAESGLVRFTSFFFWFFVFCFLLFMFVQPFDSETRDEGMHWNEVRACERARRTELCGKGQPQSSNDLFTLHSNTLEVALLMTNVATCASLALVCACTTTHHAHRASGGMMKAPVAGRTQICVRDNV